MLVRPSWFLTHNHIVQVGMLIFDLIIERTLVAAAISQGIRLAGEIQGGTHMNTSISYGLLAV